jgi:hypothetical protein
VGSAELRGRLLIDSVKSVWEKNTGSEQNGIADIKVTELFGY